MNFDPLRTPRLDPLLISPLPRPNGQIHSKDLNIVLGLCVTGQRVAILPEPFCSRYIEAGLIEIIDCGVELPDLPMYLWYTRTES